MANVVVAMYRSADTMTIQGHSSSRILGSAEWRRVTKYYCHIIEEIPSEVLKITVFTMHCVQRTALYCYRNCLCVRSSTCLSVTLRYRRHIGWTSSKLITRIISLGLRRSEPQHRQSSPKGTRRKFGWVEFGQGRSSQQKTCNISETGQDKTQVTIDD